MAPKFGTSGLRGLVGELTDDLIAGYVRAFVFACDTGGRVFVGHDLRASSPHMAGVVGLALREAGIASVAVGAVPTPALALAAQAAGASAIMVTGSHIPADRNGLKFYTRKGEITKSDEDAITAGLGEAPARRVHSRGNDEVDAQAGGRFLGRYIEAFGRDVLEGRRIGVYAHSAVGSLLLAETLRALGATVTILAPSDTFIPVDTEAVDPDTRGMLALWAREGGLDAIVSTDGDSDRPMLADETGRVIPGDILGQITAEALGAETVVTPISSNTGVTWKGFARVIMTKIGSPHVISAMEQVGGRVLGYEANGGTLLGFDADAPAGRLPALVTRDSFLPILATLISAPGALSARVAEEPARYTAADRLQGVAPELSAAFLTELADDPARRAAFFDFCHVAEAGIDRTDGLRVSFDDGTILHLRPSGNAPEFRVYAEADSAERATALVAEGLARLSTRVG